MASHNPPRHHDAISKQQWLHTQRKELARWTGKEMLEHEIASLKTRLLPLCAPHWAHLNSDSEILEVGSGPTCFSQWIAQGNKTFIDPLLEDFRRTYPGTIPKGRYLTAPVEQIPLASHSIDCIICIDTMSFVQNPEIALSELNRLLDDNGLLILCAMYSSPLMARLHYIATRTLPLLFDYCRPYRFTLSAMRHSIERHLSIDSEHPVSDSASIWNPFADHEQLFICRRQN
ncbi:MAG: class I SAM-dependent methyltransferase [Mariprofundales bacterium]